MFLATEQLNTLLKFRYKPELKAEDGVSGAKKKMAGRAGKDIVIKVPVGTIVKRDGKIIADLSKPNQKTVIAKGGDGGFGNAHFKSSVRQTPRMAEVGELGESFEAELELKLLAGFPNAGKSTFLSVVSNARPEIADYEFTTLTPNLGVADVDDSSLLIADIPGLIEGASDGKGLGDAFLRHIERTAVLLHLVDAYSNDVAERYLAIRRELKKYSAELASRPEIVALTKCEGLDQDIIQMQIDALRAAASEDTQVFAISSVSHKGVIDVLRALQVQVVATRAAENEQKQTDDLNNDKLETITLSGNETISSSWEVSYDADKQIYRVFGGKIEKFARRTNFDQFESVNRLRDIMRRYGITHELMRQGATGDSLVQIGESTPFTLVEQ